MCEPNGMGGFTTFLRECPKCSFWDQDLLTCVQVWFDTDECVITGHQTDPLNYTTPSTLSFFDLGVSSASLLLSFLVNYLHALHAFVASPFQGIRVTSQVIVMNCLHNVSLIGNYTCCPNFKHCFVLRYSNDIYPFPLAQQRF